MADIQPYTVIGFWLQTRERFADFYDATTPRLAEGLAQLHARDVNGTLLVAHVVDGHVQTADRYTLYLDPADERNLDAEGLEMDFPGTGDPDWTVLGIAVTPGTPDSDIWRRGERYGDIIAATSPGAAEDVARDRLREKGGELLVCAVLAGRVQPADNYATFADPDVQAQAS
jgi:hypothetical protein